MIRSLFAGAALCALSSPLAAQESAPAMVDIPAGTFVMGAPDTMSRDWFNEKPAHQVTISRPFRIAAHEVTIDDWRRFRPDTPVTTDQAPYVAGISWDDATAYAAWLSKRTGKHYRLPTEAEWEYVAQLAAKDPARYAAIKGLGGGPTEWTADLFAPYPLAPQTDPTRAVAGQLRVVRGGRMAFNPGGAKSDVQIGIG